MLAGFIKIFIILVSSNAPNDFNGDNDTNNSKDKNHKQFWFSIWVFLLNYNVKEIF